MEHMVKVVGYLKCTMNCPKHNDDRCCINCGTDIIKCGTPCGFIMNFINQGEGIGKDFISENCIGCVKQEG